VVMGAGMWVVGIGPGVGKSDVGLGAGKKEE
jgi:hypothetical protein